MSIKLYSAIPEAVKSKFQAKPGERHVPYAIDKSKDFIFKNCKEAIKQLIKGNVFYRGDKNIIDPVYIVDPKHAQRISKDSGNLYNLYMDTSPHWKGYPSRSFSVIFGNDEVASSYAGRSPLHVILPIGNPAVTISYDKDFWDSVITYTYSNSKNNFTRTLQCDVNAFSSALNMLFANIVKLYMNKEKSASVFSKAVDKLLHQMRENAENKDGYKPDEFYYAEADLFAILNDAILNGTEEPKKVFYDIMTPHSVWADKKNLSQIDKLTTEAWTDAKCVVVRQDYFNQIFEKEISAGHFKRLEV